MTSEQKGQMEKFVDELESTKAMLEAERARCHTLKKLVREKDSQLSEMVGMLNGATIAPSPPRLSTCAAGHSGSYTLGLTLDEDVLLELDDEKNARLHLEEEVTRLRRICMDLTTQMDALRRVHHVEAVKGTASAIVHLSLDAGNASLSRRPDENPQRRRPQFSTTSVQPSKSRQNVDLSKKVGLANLIHVKEVGNGNEFKNGALVQDSAIDFFGAEPQELLDGDGIDLLAQEQKKKKMLETAAAAATWNKNLGNFKLKLQHVRESSFIFPFFSV